MKIKIKIKEVEFELEDDKTTEVVKFHIENLKVLINTIFENYTKTNQ